MKAVIFPLCAALAFAVLVPRLWVLRRNWRNPPLAALCSLLFLVTTLFTLSVPAVSAWIDAVTGLPNLAAFCIHGAIVTASFSMHGLTIFWTYPLTEAWPRLRRQLVVLGIVLTIMLGLFLGAGITDRQEHYLLDNVRNPVVAVYVVFFVAVLARGQVAIALGCWRYARVAQEPWLRRGLRFVAAGAVAGMGYSATRLANVGGGYAGLDVTKIEVLVPVSAVVATFLTVIGLTLPLAGPRASRLAAGYRAYRSLAALWRPLYVANPEIALNPPRARDLFRLGDIDYRVYRRVIEIHDGRLALRRWIGEADLTAARERAQGLTGDDRDAAVEAMVLRAGLDAKHAGCPPDTPAPLGARDHDGFAAEVAWLRRVAEAFDRSG
jgi:hypothetical protein